MRNHNSQIDFYQDWINSLSKSLTDKFSVDLHGKPNDKIALHYLNLLKRIPTSKPRKVKLPNNFSPPNELSSGFKSLCEKVKSGASLFPHLSKQVLSFDNNDGLLNHWNIYHFHLGLKIKKNFIERTGPLAFAYINSDIFYMIGIFNHGAWCKQELIEIIDKNWPELISPYKYQSCTGYNKSTIEHIKDLRSKNYNHTVDTSIGTTYLPLAGVNALGQRMTDIIQLDHIKNEIQQCQLQCELQLEKILPLSEIKKCQIHFSIKKDHCEVLLNGKKWGILDNLSNIIFFEGRITDRIGT